MRTLDNKVALAARAVAVVAKVPVVPATTALPEDTEVCKKMALEVGYPLMLKASCCAARAMWKCRCWVTSTTT